MRAIVLSALFLIACCVSVAGCIMPEAEDFSEEIEMEPIKEITSFDTITITESSMRYKCEYELVSSDSQVKIAEYSIRYSDGKEQKELERSAICDVNEALTILNDCGLASWDGFYGAHPQDVSDGVMFNLDATVNDGKGIHAEGSENFPDHYRELIAWIKDKLG
ncbi:MAG: hypothetical protein K6G83_04015 [Lachnospiraceae bacterium]|nr:hypothetical protein [Lachnospiraceae bacterium]